MPANAPLNFNLPPLDRPRERGLGEFARRLMRLASAAGEVGRRGAEALTGATNRDETDDGAAVARRETGVELPPDMMGGEMEWSRATERIATGNRQVDDARHYHYSATDQLDAAAYELGVLMQELAPVVEQPLPAAPTADVVKIAQPLRPAKAPAAAAPAPVAPATAVPAASAAAATPPATAAPAAASAAKPEKRGKPRKKAPAAAA